MKYFIYSFGCKVNRYESQQISENFKRKKFTQVQNPIDADIIVFNSCTVTENADKECEYMIRKTLKLPNKPKIILTGCLAKNKNKQLDNIYPEIEIIDDKTKLYGDENKISIEGFDGRARAFIKIQDGCDSFCSYCIIPFVRNKLWSKSEKEVVEETTKLVEKGFSEIVLTGIHIGKYESGISNLVEKIIKIPLDFRIRISSIELNEIDSKLIELINKYPNKICNHLHIPMQSASDEILKKMNRKYLSKDYCGKVLQIFKNIPDLSLTTDIICGFPSETEKNHLDTYNFVKSFPFSRLHIFSYSDRIGTEAKKLKNKVSLENIKLRVKKLLEIDKEKRKEFLNKNLGKTRKAVSVGNNKALTDNYIAVSCGKISKGIFDIEVNENSKV
jgi:threonylcarbamoyladenosine tRNA methylthiotransferase MtaB